MINCKVQSFGLVAQVNPNILTRSLIIITYYYYHY